MRICVYILKFADGLHYTGITKAIDRRLREHTEGKSKSTKHHLPITFLHTEWSDNYTMARAKEKYIKRIGAGKYLALGRFD